ncbi:hypothetical protein LZG04_10680 [Saccharothrix sp. S26]|uniref:hypothetical protein n=1 Tax=Saccharothrix sp. S26 TaxID=2907215 RepID=UPI001F16D7F9|nr:hypothetical protein [Saccharothrix sp. S26]MCE6995272.1 hypothetical protein [Saccharothrix sp. S26]
MRVDRASVLAAGIAVSCVTFVVAAAGDVHGVLGDTDPGRVASWLFGLVRFTAEAGAVVAVGALAFVVFVVPAGTGRGLAADACAAVRVAAGAATAWAVASVVAVPLAAGRGGPGAGAAVVGLVTAGIGPNELATAAIRIAARLGRLNEAAMLARTTAVPDTRAVHHRARHYLAAAHALAVRGDGGDAVFALLEVEAAGPEDIRYAWLAQRTLQQLVRRGNRLIRTDLDRLATLAGLACISPPVPGS